MVSGRGVGCAPEAPTAPFEPVSRAQRLNLSLGFTSSTSNLVQSLYTKERRALVLAAAHTGVIVDLRSGRQTHLQGHVRPPPRAALQHWVGHTGCGSRACRQRFPIVSLCVSANKLVVATADARPAGAVEGASACAGPGQSANMHACRRVHLGSVECGRRLSPEAAHGCAACLHSSGGGRLTAQRGRLAPDGRTFAAMDMTPDGLLLATISVGDRSRLPLLHACH
jgi:hypothetical protein